MFLGVYVLLNCWDHRLNNHECGCAVTNYWYVYMTWSALRGQRDKEASRVVLNLRHCHVCWARECVVTTCWWGEWSVWGGELSHHHNHHPQSLYAAGFKHFPDILHSSLMLVSVLHPTLTKFKLHLSITWQSENVEQNFPGLNIYIITSTPPTIASYITLFRPC